ncbi:hypothetical protein D3C73_1147340 [compost metagenome]
MLLTAFAAVLSSATVFAGLAKITEQAQWRVRGQPGGGRGGVLLAFGGLTLVFAERAAGRMLGGAGVVLEKQCAGAAIEGDIEHRQGVLAAIAGQPLVGAAHLHQ